ncbi:HAD family phosphatase [Mycoplasma flocculare]|uniref:HAD family phosphatase n=1 Tax=Mesomycoplasma flocculare TaxID=2128 RepID=A0AAW9XA46_MESFC|nr:HAD family hydrolase [Mesomycoplasma flocculare]MXR05975.1 HAD family phosphatase [Mesomycoplasma flocculare]MXR12342.1 HAD family phosphatase [Mesomycoplasma flocculare]MXR39521.1 HAD family phosphatase [Mycoplasma sp. MF12]MXR56798.1 HAD family phosphatase [Mesomycoplasma flocculare]
MDKKNKNVISQKQELNKIKNFVFDLDGTLLTSEHEISPKTVAKITELRSKQKKIIFCSGRPWYFIKKYYFQLKPDFPVISCNGSLIYDFKKNLVIFRKSFEPNQVQNIFNILVKYSIIFLIYTTTNMLAFSEKNKNCSWFSYLKEQNDNFSEIEKLPLNFYDYLDFNQKKITNLEVVKFLLIKRDSDPELFQKAISELEKIENIYLVQSQSAVIDIMISGSNKGEGLKFLAQNYQLDLEKTLVFGDATNDLPMFATAKFSVAMGQSAQNVQKKATFITKPNDQDGIAYFLEKYYE